jgi:hypothetical protein
VARIEIIALATIPRLASVSGKGLAIHGEGRVGDSHVGKSHEGGGG